MINVLIVEDSERDVRLYKDALRSAENVNLFCVLSGEEAIELIKTVYIDVFFLDIDLPGIDGFALAKKIRAITKYALSFIVFISGYSKNQLEVFKELHCYDYIVKPFSMDEFTSKLTELIKRIQSANGEANKTRMILLTTGIGEYLLNPEGIYFAETQRNDCFLHTENGMLRLAGISLKEVIHSINDEFFIRCHRSFAVNIRRIYQIEPINYRLWKIILSDSAGAIDVSSKYFDEVTAKCGILSNW